MSGYCRDCGNTLCICKDMHEYSASNSSSDDQPQKPDATAREWLIAEATEHTDERVLPASFELFPGWDKSGYIHVIEKSAYDALKARVAELETETENIATRRSKLRARLAISLHWVARDCI